MWRKRQTNNCVSQPNGQVVGIQRIISICWLQRRTGGPNQDKELCQFEELLEVLNEDWIVEDTEAPECLREAEAPKCFDLSRTIGSCAQTGRLKCEW